MSIRFPVILLALLALSPFATARAQELPRLAVLSLEANGMKEAREAATEELRKAFVKSGRYIVIDRSLTDQIMKEWELQQSGVTDQDRAVRVGKLFNVKIIVAGRINRLGEDGWQVSAAMLDAETGVTRNAETIRHQGSVFGLINDKMPLLGTALAGGAPIPAAAPAQRPGTPAAGPTRQLAIFPPVFQGQNADSFKPGVIPAETAEMKEVEYWLPDVKVTHRLSDNTLLAKDVWSGLFTKEPDMDVVLRRGKDLGVDLIFMLRSVSDPGKIEYDAYLIDVPNLRQYHRKGKWKPGVNPEGWVPTVGRAAKTLAIEERLTTATGWPNPPTGKRLGERQIAELFGKPITFYYLLPDTAGTIEYLARGRTLVHYPGGRVEGSWRLYGDRICTTSATPKGPHESCSQRWDLGNSAFRIADDKGKSVGVWQILR